MATNRKISERDPISAFLPDDGEWNLALQELARDYVRDALKTGLQSGAAEIGLAASMDVFNPEVLRFLETYVIRLAGNVHETVTNKIRDAIGEGLQQGESYRDIRGRVLEAFGCKRNEAGKIIADEKLKYRAEMIARTETDRAQNAGRQLQLEEAGAKRKVWKANPGACEFCQALDGTTIGVGEDFFKRGDTFSADVDGTERTLKLDYSDTPHPPLHPNCLCVTEYSFD